MLKVKHLTPFKQKKWKKAGNLTKVEKKSSSARFFATQHPVTRFSLILTKIYSLSNASSFRALALILTELWPFSPHNIWKSDFFNYFVKLTPHNGLNYIKYLHMRIISRNAYICVYVFVCIFVGLY